MCDCKSLIILVRLFYFTYHLKLEVYVLNAKRVLDRLLAPEICDLGNEVLVGKYKLDYTGIYYNVAGYNNLDSRVKLVVFHCRDIMDGALFMYDRKNLLFYSNGKLVEYSGKCNSFQNGYVWLDADMIPYFRLGSKIVHPVSCMMSDLMDLSIFNWIRRGTTYMLIPVEGNNTYNSFELVKGERRSNGISYTEPDRCIDVAVFGNDGFYRVFSYEEYQLMMKCGLTSILQLMECTSYGMSTSNGTLTVKSIRDDITFISNNLVVIKNRIKSTYWFRGILFIYETKKDRTLYLIFRSKNGILVPKMVFIEEEHNLVVKEGIDVSYVLRGLV